MYTEKTDYARSAAKNANMLWNRNFFCGVPPCAAGCAGWKKQKRLASCDARRLSGEDEIRTRGRIAPTSV